MKALKALTLATVLAVLLVTGQPARSTYAALTDAQMFSMRKSVALANRIVASNHRRFTYHGYLIHVVELGVDLDSGNLYVSLEAWKDGVKVFGPGHEFFFHNPPVSTKQGVLDLTGTFEAMVGSAVELSHRRGDDSDDDPVLTVYPDPGNPGTTSCDGDIGVNVASSWSSAHSTATCTDCSGSTTLTTESSVDSSGTQFSCIRTLLLFDTSSLTAGATISSATMSVKTQTQVFDFDGSDSVQVVTSSPASNTTYSTSDYGSFGTTDQATAISIGSMSGNAYQTWTLNSTGLSNISKTSVTKFALRTNKDVSNSAPTPQGGGSGGCLVFWNSADNTGTTSDPHLDVTYTGGGSSGGTAPRRIFRIG